MDPSRAAELTDFIQNVDAEIPINPELLALVDQALTHVSTGGPATWNGWNSSVMRCCGSPPPNSLTATTLIWRWVPAPTCEPNWSATAGWRTWVQRSPSKHISCWGVTPRGIVPPNPGYGPMPPKL